jgi:hypothetical protein
MFVAVKSYTGNFPYFEQQQRSESDVKWISMKSLKRQVDNLW